MVNRKRVKENQNLLHKTLSMHLYGYPTTTTQNSMGLKGEISSNFFFLALKRLSVRNNNKQMNKNILLLSSFWGVVVLSIIVFFFR